MSDADERTLTVDLPAEVPAGEEVSDADLRRRRPRSYQEWKTLLRWGVVPARERAKAGYLMRLARESAGMTQRQLAKRLGCSQQAVAQAERWQSNPTVELMDRWARACGTDLSVSFGDPLIPEG